MPVPFLATAAVGVLKFSKKVGGFFKGLFGGKAKRLKRRLNRQAAKFDRLTNASRNIFENSIAKLQAKADLGNARARTRLARLQKRMAKSGVSPSAIDGLFGKAPSFELPLQLTKTRAPQQMQLSPQEAAALGASFQGSAASVDSPVLAWVKSNPLQAAGLAVGAAFVIKKIL